MDISAVLEVTGDNGAAALIGLAVGAILGGLIFGSGMVLARGCSGRLLVLAAGGNLRALLSGLVFAVVAQMSLYGVLVLARTALASLWTTGPTNIELASFLGLGSYAGLSIGVILAATALIAAWRALGGLAKGAAFLLQRSL